MVFSYFICPAPLALDAFLKIGFGRRRCEVPGCLLFAGLEFFLLPKSSTKTAAPAVKRRLSDQIGTTTKFNTGFLKAFIASQLHVRLPTFQLPPLYMQS